MGLWAGKVMFSGVFYPLLILGPPVAKALKGFGWGKSHIREYLWDNTWVPVEDVERSSYGTAGVPTGVGAGSLTRWSRPPFSGLNQRSSSERFQTHSPSKLLSPATPVVISRKRSFNWGTSEHRELAW
jgi:hypothetical protein